MLLLSPIYNLVIQVDCFWRPSNDNSVYIFRLCIVSNIILQFAFSFISSSLWQHPHVFQIFSLRQFILCPNIFLWTLTYSNLIYKQSSACCLLLVGLFLSLLFEPEGEGATPRGPLNFNRPHGVMSRKIGLLIIVLNLKKIKYLTGQICYVTLTFRN